MFLLLRECVLGKAVMGRLTLGGETICYTLENADKLIPCGVYSLENSKSPKFKRTLPLVYSDKVSASRGIRIHRGNTADDTKGCILVGLERKDYVVSEADKYGILDSTDAEKMVVALCRQIRQMAIVTAY